MKPDVGFRGTAEVTTLATPTMGERWSLHASGGNDPTVWTGRVLQAGCERWRGLVLRFCIRPVNRAFMLLAIMDIRTHPISFCERP